MMLVPAILVIGSATTLIVWLVLRLNKHLDQRADAWQRNHAHKRRWYE